VLESVWLDYALLVAIPGMMGLSGDLIGLTVEQRARIAQAIAFYKQWRPFITGSVGHLLTPPAPMDRREGWIGFQLQAPDGDTSLVFTYRLANAGAAPAFRLHGLDPTLRYTVQNALSEPTISVTAEGESLMRSGLPCSELKIGAKTVTVCVVKKEFHRTDTGCQRP